MFTIWCGVLGRTLDGFTPRQALKPKQVNRFYVVDVGDTQENVAQYRGFFMDLNDQQVDDLPTAICSGGTLKMCEWLDSTEHILISDKDEGLTGAAEQELPNTHHMKCFKHITRNMAANSRLEKGASVSAASWALQSAKSKQEFDKKISEMVQEFPLAAQYLQDIPHETWALYAIEDLAKKTYGQVLF